ncbi:hypothetical protein [Methanoregula sp.]|uniref:hypothetical protein n=1 Tax=Methanoregula sp. TaxID=2052170 RepID=UPI00356B0B8A
MRAQLTAMIHNLFTKQTYRSIFLNCSFDNGYVFSVGMVANSSIAWIFRKESPRTVPILKSAEYIFMPVIMSG